MKALIRSAYLRIMLVVAFVVSMVPSAFAALDLVGVTVNTADVETIMGIVIVGLAVLWGFRKVIKTTNRS